MFDMLVQVRGLLTTFADRCRSGIADRRCAPPGGRRAGDLVRAGGLAALIVVHAASVGQGQASYGWTTNGTKILTPAGGEFVINGVNWYGFETKDAVAHGLGAKDFKVILDQVKQYGYNTVRLPFSNEMWESNPVATNVAACPSCGGKRARDIMAMIINYAGSIGLHVILDNHRSTAGNSAQENGLWYTSTYPEQAWISDWRSVQAWVHGIPQTLGGQDTVPVNPFAADGFPTVLGFDLRNEPHTPGSASYLDGSTWGTGDGIDPRINPNPNPFEPSCVASSTCHDWRLAAERAATTLLGDAQQNGWEYPVIFVEGVSAYPKAGGTAANGPYASYWWGGNLLGVNGNESHAGAPIVLNAGGDATALGTPVYNQLVYSTHDYGPALSRQPWFNSNTCYASGCSASSLSDIWTRYWAHLNLPGGINPVWPGQGVYPWGNTGHVAVIQAPIYIEFGTANSDTDLYTTGAGSQGQWMTDIVNFIQSSFLTTRTATNDAGIPVSDLHWTYWALNDEDSYALLGSGYTGLENPKKEYSFLCSIQQGPLAVPMGSAPGRCGSTGALPLPDDGATESGGTAADSGTSEPSDTTVAAKIAAATVTISPSTTTNLTEGDDFFTTVINNRLDFDARRDLLWEENFSEPITVSGGVWAGTFAGSAGYIFPLFPGFDGGLNFAPDGRGMGEHFPIDTTKYKLFSIRRKVSSRNTVVLSVGNEVSFTVSKICDGPDGYYTPNSTVNFAANAFTLDWYDFRQTKPTALPVTGNPEINGLCDGSDTSAAWTGEITNIRFEPAAGAGSGATASFDWIRVVDPTSASDITLSGSTTDISSSSCGLSACKVNIYIDTDASGFDGDFVARVPLTDSSYTLTFPSAALPPGTYYFYAEVRNNQGTDATLATSSYSGAFVVNGKTTLTVDNPSLTSGPDYATEVLDNAWDFNTSSDVANLDRVQSEKRFTNPRFEGGIFTATADGPAEGATESDAQVWMNVDATESILTHRYRYLTYRMSIDATGYGNISDKVQRGHLSRMVWWNVGIQEDGSATRGAVVYEDTHDYTLDLTGSAVIVTDDDYPANTGWRGNSSIEKFRIDPVEVPFATDFSFYDVKLRGRPEPDASTREFTIQVTTSDPESNTATLQFYRDSNDSGFDGTLLGTLTGKSPGTHTFSFDTSTMFPQDFYIYVVATDSAGNVTRQYGRAPVHIPPQTWQNFFAVDPLETPYVGDFDGDGKTDIITFTRQNPNAFGDVYVSLSLGDRFESSSTKWHDFFAINTSEQVIIGDFDGDGKDDIGTWLSDTTKQVYVALSLGTGMGANGVWVDSIGGASSDLIFAGDANGDGKDDLIDFARTQGKVYVALSDGSRFGTPTVWHNFFAVSTYERPRVADVNGDGKADIVTFATDSSSAYGDVYVATSTGSQFVDLNGAPNSSSKWHDFFAISPTEEVRIGDINNDGKDDFFTFLPAPYGQAYVVESQGDAMGSNVLWAEEDLVYRSTDNPYVGDVNGDGKADIILFSQVPGKVKVVLTP